MTSWTVLCVLFYNQFWGLAGQSDCPDSDSVPKYKVEPGLVAHTFNYLIKDRDAWISVSYRPADTIHQVPGCLGLHSEILFLN